MIRRPNEAMLQRVMDGTPHGIIVFRAERDAHGVIDDFRVVFANRSAMLLLGLDELVGRSLVDGLQPFYSSGMFDSFSVVVGSEVTGSAGFRCGPEGAERSFKGHMVRFEDGLLFTFMDGMDLAQATEIDIETDHISIARRITRTVAHEVRNPLTNIQLAMEQLRDDVGDGREGFRSSFEIIERNVKRIAGLINGMVDATKLRTIEPVPCMMVDLVKSVAGNVAERSSTERVRVEVNVPMDLPVVVVDRQQMVQALTYLAINALEAMKDGDGVLRLIAFRSGNDVVLELTDNGKGIAASDQARLFDPFYSGHGGAIGLGLTTARSILDGHKVKLFVRSKVGEGSTFSVRFPGREGVPSVSAGLVAN